MKLDSLTWHMPFNFFPYLFFTALKSYLMSRCIRGHLASTEMKVTNKKWQREMIKGVWFLTASWSSIPALTLLFLLLERNDPYLVTWLLSVSCYMHLDTTLTNTRLCLLLNLLNFYYYTHHTEFSLLIYIGFSTLQWTTWGQSLGRA